VLRNAPDSQLKDIFKGKLRNELITALLFEGENRPQVTKGFWHDIFDIIVRENPRYAAKLCGREMFDIIVGNSLIEQNMKALYYGTYRKSG
jgi:hypothetical protein